MLAKYELISPMASCGGPSQRLLFQPADPISLQHEQHKAVPLAAPKSIFDLFTQAIYNCLVCIVLHFGGLATCEIRRRLWQ
jgi:hypothetical protein